jgi:LPXTG-motif cell wall-anchored protein
MKSPQWSRRLIPTILGAAMLSVIVFAALTPNIGVGAAQVNAQYQSNTGPNNTLEYALIGVLVAAIVAAVVGLLIFQRRKNRGQGGAGGVAAWEEPQGGSPGSGPSMDNLGGGGGMAPAGAAAVGGVAGGAAAASYDETTPADTGPEWAEPAAPATMGATAGGAAVMDESEPDIDRLMKELDQISDDILKKTPPKKGSPPDTPAAGTDADA